MSTKKPKRTARSFRTDSPILFRFLRTLSPGTSVIALAVSDSMTPSIKKGEEIVITRAVPQRIRKGDVMAYVGPNKKLLVHRVASRVSRNGNLTFQTKGDNLNTPDPYVTAAENVVGLVHTIHGKKPTPPLRPRWVQLVLLLLLAEAVLQLFDFGRFMLTVYDAKQDARDWYMDDPRNSWTSSVDISLTSYYHPFIGWRYRSVSSPYVNVEPDLSRRTVGNPSTPGLPTVYFFGGSSMWGVYAKDDETIASYFTKKMNRDRPAIAAVNYGHLSYNSNQELMFLIELLKDGNRPDYVIFYDGCNDLRSAPERVRSEGALSATLSDVNTIVYPKAALAYWTPMDLVRNMKRTLTEHIRIIRYPYAAVSWTIKRILGAPSVPRNDPSPWDIATYTVSNYRKNAEVVDMLSRAYGFKYLLLWQPTIYDKPLTPNERSFPKANDATRIAHKYVKSLLESAAIPNFSDMSGMFAASHSSSLFTDECHVIPEANAVIADHIETVFKTHHHTR